jgi:hypothetical protein
MNSLWRNRWNTHFVRTTDCKPALKAHHRITANRVNWCELFGALFSLSLTPAQSKGGICEPFTAQFILFADYWPEGAPGADFARLLS